MGMIAKDYGYLEQLKFMYSRPAHFLLSLAITIGLETFQRTYQQRMVSIVAVHVLG